MDWLKAAETTRGVVIIGWPINISNQTHGVVYSQNLCLTLD